MDTSEDYLLNVGYLEREIRNHCSYSLVFSLENQDLNVNKVFEGEKQRKLQLIKRTNFSLDITPLILSSDHFLVKKEESMTILAGYPWFSDWGRDTLISLPGLTLVTKRFNIAREILRCLQKTCKNGIIPNTHNDKTGESAYNTVDASLWFIDRVYQYMKYTDDHEFLESVYPVLENIIDSYHKGTINDIYMDKDYLISHGPGLTWMDIKMGNHYPTPRSKKAVEIQGLWYHDLCVMDLFSNILNKSSDYGYLSEKVKSSFCDQYNKQYDVIDTRDDSCRPNKILLCSLDNIMIDLQLQREIIDDIQYHLMTVFGPRTVSKEHPQYKGYYFGNYPRDITYHNGMVWPWLLGPFITSFVKTKNHSEQSRKTAFELFLKPLYNIYGNQWDGSIHEIFDGNPIFEPRGCINQAWSVGEILRTYVEDILFHQPPYGKKYQLKKVIV
jgi:predicted glycogen debranching enzyme